MQKFLGIQTGFKELPFYLAGLLSVPLALYTFHFLEGAFHYIDMHLIVDYNTDLNLDWLYPVFVGTFIFSPCIFGFIISKYFEEKLGAFCWGVFLGMIAFQYLNRKTGYGEGFLPEMFQAIISAGVVAFSVSAGALVEELSRGFLQRKK